MSAWKFELIPRRPRRHWILFRIWQDMKRNPCGLENLEGFLSVWLKANGVIRVKSPKMATGWAPVSEKKRPGLGSCPERDLHFGAQLLQKRLLWRCSHGRCHRGGVVLQVLDRSCLSGALQSAGPGQSFGEQQPRDPLEFGIQLDRSQRHQGGEPGVGSGFRCGSARRLSKTLPVPDSSGFFDPHHLLFRCCTLSSRFRLTFAV